MKSKPDRLAFSSIVNRVNDQIIHTNLSCCLLDSDFGFKLLFFFLAAIVIVCIYRGVVHSDLHALSLTEEGKAANLKYVEDTLLDFFWEDESTAKACPTAYSEVITESKKAGTWNMYSKGPPYRNLRARSQENLRKDAIYANCIAVERKKKVRQVLNNQTVEEQGSV
jgi:hypothetical protein